MRSLLPYVFGAGATAVLCAVAMSSTKRARANASTATDAPPSWSVEYQTALDNAAAAQLVTATREDYEPMTTPSNNTSNVITPAPYLPSIKFVEAKNYRRGARRSRAIWIVLHATDGWEGIRKAEDGAAELAKPAEGSKPRSAHVIVDTDSAVQCVPWECEAWHAGAHANQYGEGVELCGRAGQSRAEWLDALSLPMLSIAAQLVRWRADTLGIPIVHIGPTELRTLRPGITTHADVSKAFPTETTHWDPGGGFPLTEFLEAVRAASPLRVV